MKTFSLRCESVVKNDYDGSGEIVLIGPDGRLYLSVPNAHPFRVGAAVTITVDDTPAGDVLTTDWPDGGNAP